MNKKRKGFTLIELLAVIVILGLLMAIAIPSVTKYITQSRKKTITTTIGNYIGALTNQVNDMEYIFTESNTVYAVPIECIALERGGTNPFGEWMQASNSYWAYVLVQYDDATSSYTYGFTFKDSAGYGLYPTTIEKLKESGSQILTDLDLTRPTSGTITNITAKANWTGFNVNDDTNLVVLEATSEGETGDGIETCTLCQKGDNYNEVEQEKLTRPQLLTKLIKTKYALITTPPTLTTTNDRANEKGLYFSNETNNGAITYYFRGVSPIVKFAGLNWRVIRINEDGTIRLLLSDIIGDYAFNSVADSFDKMYYSNSTLKPIIDEWYLNNLNEYDKYISTGLFCEQARVKQYANLTSGNENMIYYPSTTPTFKCSTDKNGKGILNLKIGLITYDELIFAGGYPGLKPQGFTINLYLWRYIDYFWTMSPAGFGDQYGGTKEAIVWAMGSQGTVNKTNYHADTSTIGVSPVINLNANVKATGTGTSSDPYVVETN